MLKNILKILQALSLQAVLFISYALQKETMRKQPQCGWHNSSYYLNVFVKPNEQCRACSDIVMARIGNRQHGALGEVERQNALFEERKRTFSLSQMNNVELARTLSWRENALLRNEKRTSYSGQHKLLFQTNIPSQSFFTFDITD